MDIPSTKDIVEIIFDMALIRSAANDGALFAVKVNLVLVPFFYMIMFVWNYASTTIRNLGSRPKFFDKVELLRGLIIWFIIGFYIPIFGTIDRMAAVICDVTTPVDYVTWKKNHAKVITTIPDQSQDIFLDPKMNGKEEDESFSWESLANGMYKMMNFGTNLLVGGVTALMNVLGFIISLVVMGISLIIGKVMFMIGPFALAFSILPMFKDKLNRWFGVWLLCLLNPVTVNMLNILLMNVTAEHFTNMASANETWTTGTGVLVFNVIIVICYLLTFFLTSMFVGTPDAGKILSTAAGIASMATMKGALSAKGGPSGASGVVDNIVGATSKKE